MFDMNKIGKKIKTARTEKNMTQMDLADAMGISYQAVSNWERGNSMPDISKLPELCNILGLNLDEFLGDDDTVETVKKMIADEEAPITLEELADVAPIVPPKKMGQILVDNENEDDFIDIDALIALAPFLDDDYLNELAERIAFDHLDQLVGLAPFIDEDVLGEIVLKYARTYEGTIDAIIALAPFLEEDALDQMVDNYLTTESCDFSELVELCPFLDEKTVRKIADYVMKRKDYKTLGEIAPFM